MRALLGPSSVWRRPPAGPVLTAARIAALLAVVLAGRGGTAGGGTASPGFSGLVAGPAAIACGAHAEARVLEATGSAAGGDSAAELGGSSFRFSRTAGPAADSGAVVVTARIGAHSVAADVTLPIISAKQAALDGALPMEFEGALRRLPTAGRDADLGAARYWRPIGGARDEPVFQFESLRLGGELTVGVVPGRVSRAVGANSGTGEAPIWRG